jgi:hypothetical protein
MKIHSTLFKRDPFHAETWQSRILLERRRDPHAKTTSLYRILGVSDVKGEIFTVRF